ncbi:hypothetical protein B0H63DRAFT_542116 [Podospora didyma]|uniref:Uncharacterized protein n=1 Tax=Podospora didyma TaxID=330526 RepID=A0AAE0NUL6_9PEZI|nr:hypothetical protein B0H63DRAFT_542116 [Podospora didyma]
MADMTTTAFRPDPTCVEPSNLWLDVYQAPYGCTTYYPAFSYRPTDGFITRMSCPYTFLGPKSLDIDDRTCYQDNAYPGAGIAYSDCPECMTAASARTAPWLDSIAIVGTDHLKSAYGFEAGNTIPTPTPSDFSGSTYPVAMTLSEQLCKAASAAWTYEHDFIVAEPARIWKYLYPDLRSGDASATSTNASAGEQLRDAA